MSFSDLAHGVLRAFQPGRKSQIENRVEHLKKFVSYEPTGGRYFRESLNLAKLRIVWVIPDFAPGAGGHMTIFRIASYLERFGHDVRFLVQNPIHHKTGAAAIETINRYFQPFSGAVDLFEKKLPDIEGDALIATDRFTCYAVRAMDRFARKFYFVQDYEPSFYPSGSEALLTEATYHFDYDCLCAGDWLHRRMSQQYGRWSMSWPLAYDADIYNLGAAGNDRNPNRIALYARYVTPRRAVELAFMALDVLKARNLNFEVDFFGWKLGKLRVGYPYRDHGVIDSKQLAQLYRSAAIGVVFSATNHSLVNKEMMACGLPVVDLDLDTVRSIFPDNAMAFAPPTPEGIATQIQRLLENPDERERLRTGALEYVSDLSWEKSARLVEDAIRLRVKHAIECGAN